MDTTPIQETTVQINKPNNTPKIMAILIILVIVGGIAMAVFIQENNSNTPSNQEESEQPATEIADIPYDQLPTAPAGYMWVTCNNMSSYFLAPKDWYKLEETAQGTEACFIAREAAISQGGQFKTGLSVNMVTSVIQRTGTTASDYAQTYIQTAKDTYNGTEIENLGDGDVFQGYATEVTLEDKDLTMYMLAMANDYGDKVYIITYESPTDLWEDDWEIGSTIIEQMALDGDASY